MMINSELTVVMKKLDGYAATWKHLRMIVSEVEEFDNNVWIHASVSRADGNIPTYDDLKQLKRLCIGDDKTAIQVFPPLKKHIDNVSHLGIEVLHLWSGPENLLPDFSRAGNTI